MKPKPRAFSLIQASIAKVIDGESTSNNVSRVMELTLLLLEIC